MPRRGTTIPEKQRTHIQTIVSVENFDPRQNYWVAISRVAVEEEDWERLLEKYDPEQDSSPQIMALMQSWSRRKFLPKFKVDKTPKSVVIEDDGFNPVAGEEPQPIEILLFKADDQLDKRIKKWMRERVRARNPGLPADSLSENLILDRCEIFFF